MRLGLPHPGLGRRVVGVLVAITVSLSAAACGSSGESPGPIASTRPGISGSTLPSSSSTTTPASPTTVAGSESLSLGDSANGQTVSARVGQVVLVTLQSTDWMFEPISDSSVASQSQQSILDGPIACRTLSDCGYVTTSIVALNQGTVVVRATREKCGELVRCDGSKAVFSLMIVVRAPT